MQTIGRPLGAEAAHASTEALSASVWSAAEKLNADAADADAVIVDPELRYVLRSEVIEVVDAIRRPPAYQASR
jgi:hypothetical protein